MFCYVMINFEVKNSSLLNHVGLFICQTFLFIYFFLFENAKQLPPIKLVEWCCNLFGMILSGTHYMSGSYYYYYFSSPYFDLDLALYCAQIK